MSISSTLFQKMFPNINFGNCSISDYFLPKRGKILTKKSVIKGYVPVVAGGLSPSTCHNMSNTSSPVITISASGANAGFVKLWSIPVWSSDSSFIDKTIINDIYFWFILLKQRQKEIFDSQTGSAQPHIYPQHIGNLKIKKIDFEQTKKFNGLVTPFFDQIKQNNSEIKSLEMTKKLLLNKLF